MRGWGLPVALEGWLCARGRAKALLLSTYRIGCAPWQRRLLGCPCCRYNCACALARAGRPAEAAELLRGLLAGGAVAAADVAADADLAGVAL